MPFGHDAKPTIVYKYRCLPPTENAALVWDQLRLAHQYRNQLCAIELERRREIDEFLAKNCPQLAATEEKLKTIEDWIEHLVWAKKNKNQGARKKGKHPDIDERIARAKALRKELAAIRKALRASLFSKDGLLQPINDKAHAARIKARSECGLYSGTYLFVENACKDFGKGPPPYFKPFRGEGTLAIQLQYGLPVGQLLVSDTRVMVDAWLPVKPNLYFRVKSDPNKRPIFAIFPIVDEGNRNYDPNYEVMVCGRPIPHDAEITWAYLTVKRIATKSIYHVCFVIRRTDGWKKPDCAPAESPIVAVNVCWRRVYDGCRVAYWADSEGKQGKVVLPNEEILRRQKVDDLQSIRDKHLDGIKEVLGHWLHGRNKMPQWAYDSYARIKNNPPHRNAKTEENLEFERRAFRALLDGGIPGNKIPKWLTEALANIHLVRSSRKLAKIILRWREERFAGDDVMYNFCEAWRKRDKHLYEWQENQRQNVLASRKHVYRNLAAEFRRRYSKAIICEFDLRDISEDEETPSNIQWFRSFAAPSELTDAIKKQMPIALVKPKTETEMHPLTQTCHLCRHVQNDFDAAKNLYHKCESCGAEWDQDYNHCMNLLRSASSDAMACPPDQLE